MGQGRGIEQERGRVGNENRKGMETRRGRGDTPRPVDGNWSQLKLGLGENGRILDPFAS